MCRPDVVNCGRCGCNLPAGRRGRLPVTCKSCQVRVWRDQRATCKRCGKEFNAGSRGRFPAFCSSSCSQRVRRETQGPQLIRSQCDSCGCAVLSTSRRKWCDPCGVRLRSAELFSCKQCGKQFKKKGGRTKLMFCSMKCYADSKRIPQCEKELIHRLDDIIRNARHQRRLAARQQREESRRRKTCKACACVFAVDAGCGKKFPRFCSTACREGAKQRRKKPAKQKGSRKHTTRAKRRGLPRQYSITLTKVAERDAWMCNLCGEPVARLDDFLSPRAPCIDHIVPLNMKANTRHGHTWDNVQLAHRKCNEAKGCTVACHSLLECDSPRQHIKTNQIDQTPPQVGLFDK